jgi:glyoxylase-like metal-dependent hydrolase (beta-lactamase superfamily II)
VPIGAAAAVAYRSRNIEGPDMPRLIFVGLCFSFLAATAAAQQPDKQPENIVLREGTRQLSPHVHVLYGNPNIGIVIGSKASLVIDTGLGKPNGAVIAAEVAKLRKSPKLFLTTTHYHPEHAAGQDGFPADTVVVRNKVQQDELDASGAAMIADFSSRNDTNRGLLAGAKPGNADVLFGSELTLDLGDVKVRLMWFGPAHTNGDMLALVEGDSVLVSGDVVQNKVAFSLSGTKTTFASWFAVLDKVAQLKPAIILPDHSLPGDASMIAEQRAFMLDLQERTRALKKEGKSTDETARLISGELAQRYPTWGRMMFVPRAVASAYQEAP